VLEEFRKYFKTATLEDVTDPNLVYNLRAKLDAAGYYDEFEVDRVAAAELNPASKQSDLVRALEPVADRLMRQFKAASNRWKTAQQANDEATVEEAHTEMETLVLFKRDMGSFGHAYTFLSQIFDYGNTGLEKRAIFYKRLSPLLEFGREREGVDLSKVVLTHHMLRNKGSRTLPLGEGDSPTLKPLTDAGSGSVQEKEKARLGEIIAKVNDLFGADTTEGDKLIYVNDVIKGKLMESDTLVQQAVNNTKEQFANSPDLANELLSAIMDASSALSSLSKQALESEHVRSGLKDVLLGPAQLYEALRAKGEGAGVPMP
jgi:type I restriction enzyme R subunit